MFLLFAACARVVGFFFSKVVWHGGRRVVWGEGITASRAAKEMPLCYRFPAQPCLDSDDDMNGGDDGYMIRMWKSPYLPRSYCLKTNPDHFQPGYNWAPLLSRYLTLFL